MESTRAQGQLTTKNSRLRYIQTDHKGARPMAIRTTGGSRNRARAEPHTTGVYTRANLLMNTSDLAFRLLASSTSSRILETVDSPNSLVVRMVSTPLWLMQPLITSLPGSTSRGRLSPVSAAVSRAGDHHAVDGYLFPGLHGDHRPHRHFIRVHLLQLAVLFNVGIVRPDVHQVADVPPAFVHRIILEQFSHLIEQHDGHGFRKIGVFVDAQAESPQAGHRHQEVLVQHLTPFDVLQRLAQDIVGNDHIRRQVRHQVQHPGGKVHTGSTPAVRQKACSDGQQGADGDPPDHVFLFLFHIVSPLRRVGPGPHPCGPPLSMIQQLLNSRF